MTGHGRAAKRALDIVGAGAGLILLSIPMGAIAIAVHRSMGPPVMFTQPRPGQDGRIFTLYKFRTMRGSPTDGGADEDRLTPLGAFLRRWSLDELPEFMNVLKGDMSLVGPRPLLPRYLPRYSAQQSRRHEVRPGITGWAQIHGRNALSWPERFELDVWYVDNWSFRLDLEILWRTLLLVLRREGISADGHATMPEFMGEGKHL